MAQALAPTPAWRQRRWARALWSQWQVLAALFYREAETRRGRSFALGYLADAVEPLIIIGTIGLLFSVIARTPPYGPNLLLFLGTGVFPIYLFIHTSMRIRQPLGAGVHRNRYPIENPIDHVLAHGLLHLISSALVSILFFTALYLGGVKAAMPYDLGTAIEALGALFLLGIAMGIFNSVVARLFPLWDVIWPAFARASLHFSGPYFVAAYLRPNERWFFEFNPIIHGVDWFRHAFYPFYPDQLTNVRFLLLTAFVLLTVGLLLEAGTRRYLEDKE